MVKPSHDPSKEAPTVPVIAPTRDERAEAAGAGASASAVVEAAPRIEHDGILARGGMGVIHRVFDRAIGRRAAMKVIDPDSAGDPVAARRFVLEARVTGQLDHPNVVPLYDFVVDEAGEPKHFTMKLVAGETLGQNLARTSLPDRTDDELWELLQAFLRVCDAMAFAHSHGVVHCDLKPDNVMLGEYGQVYVMDWGIARLLPGSSVRADRPDEWEGIGFALGTTQYMAPEQAWGRVNEIDARTDVFALGGILYAILTGQPPHRAATPSETLALARSGVVRDPAEVAGTTPVSPSLGRIAMRALSADPAKRPASVEAMKREVESALRGGLWFGSSTFPAGAVILREGDPGDAAYIITHGRCAVTRTTDGYTRVLREMGPGEAFGEMALVTDRPRSATVSAIDEVTVTVITRAALERELQAGSWMGTLVRSLAERFRDLEGRAATPTR